MLQEKLKSEIKSLQTKLNETEERLKGKRLTHPFNWKVKDSAFYWIMYCQHSILSMMLVTYEQAYVKKVLIT